MKKLLAVLLALTFVISMFAMTACSDDNGDDTDTNDKVETKDDTTDDKKDNDTNNGENTDTNEGEDTDDVVSGDEPNMFPYEGEVTPGSVDYDWGAPDATSVYFSIDEDHVIHDGKGTWNNTESCTGIYAFDNDYDTFYDCDEKCEYTNTDAMNVGTVLEDWNDDTTKTGYVGAWIEEGVVLSQIRFFPRSGYNDRAIGCKFQGSVDGVNWVDLVTITELVNQGGDYEFFDIDDDTVYYYVRFLARDLESYQAANETEDTDYYSYCNIAEMEIWGTPAK